MLKKFKDTSGSTHFRPGSAVYVVMRDGTVIEGHCIGSCLGELVSLDRSPLDGTEKQGFTIQNNHLMPNWCEGKRQILAVCMSREEAEDMASPVRQRLAALGVPRQAKPRRSCGEQ